MMKELRLGLPLLLMSIGAAAAQGSPPPDHRHMMMPGAAGGPNSAPAGAQNDAAKAFAAANDKMMAGMSRKPTGDADRDFVESMLPHHQGAVDMAQIQLRYGRDPALHRLAQRIVVAQEKEIAEMESWLRAHPAR